MRAKKMSILIGLIFVLITGNFNGAQSKHNLPDPNHPGPYSVGHTSFIMTDYTRQK